ncbi:ribose 1,5-bisphosphokinase [Vibrio sp. S9_S30]|uniref:ribose 1,5-bisphosphokinase n=1 Tax=Vibrio sp. S9_S30 TaxID=2720226 RepID=UPI001681B5F4|nr:ribose 1,5-bisphosphokinase [Vibrio sp. S9_S30]MBD1559232.1 ribose 1,5-bisphosphokinase [Vibrio sp. S9_S30]
MATLFYVMGASGSGKDSVMQAIRQDSRVSVQIAHRYITRPADSGGENHIALNHEEFHQRILSGLFSMHWEANGLHYGIGKEVELWLNQGQHVLLNGSRAYFPQAHARFKEKLVPVWIQVDVECLQSRLIARGRETHEQISARIERAKQYQRNKPSDALVIDNSGQLESSVDQFIRQLNPEVQTCN